MDSEIAGWRIAYDTVSALVAVDQSRAVSQLARQPMSASPGSAAAAAGGRDVSGSCVASETSSHCDNREVIQRQRQQQQQRGGLTQSSASTVYHSLHNVYSDYSSSPPTVTSLPGSNHFQSAAPMTPLAAECGTRGNVGVVLASSVDDRQIEDAARLVHDVDVDMETTQLEQSEDDAERRLELIEQSPLSTLQQLVVQSHHQTADLAEVTAYVIHPPIILKPPARSRAGNDDIIIVIIFYLP